MAYLLKEDVAEEIKAKYRNSYFVKTLGVSDSYISLVLNRHKKVKKVVAYSFVKVIDSEAEIEDMFELVK